MDSVLLGVTTRGNSTLSLIRMVNFWTGNTSVVFHRSFSSSTIFKYAIGCVRLPGIGLASIQWDADDLRLYRMALSLADAKLIHGGGGGDFDRLRIIGSGLTKITARQAEIRVMPPLFRSIITSR